MDHQAFDTFAKGLASNASRRRAIEVVAGGVLVTLLSRLATSNVAARGEVGDTCDRDSDCRDGGRCGKGRCHCKAGHKRCGGRCYELRTDRLHCGACGARCRPDQVCRDGGCACPIDMTATADACVARVSCGGGSNCPSDQKCCGGICVDNQTDRDHCGGCGHSCDSGREVCIDGHCQEPICKAVRATCSTADECCQDAAATQCGSTCSGGGAICCRPLGAACDLPCDCCNLDPSEDGYMAVCGASGTCERLSSGGGGGG